MAEFGSGKLIVFEGIDGSGKSTQVDMLCEVLAALGSAEVVKSKEPTEGPWGRRIRQSYHAGRMSLDEELKCFVEDRREHVRDLISPALSRGATVVLDRYFYSTIAYQGARGADVEQLKVVARGDFAPPANRVFLIDIDPAEAVARIASGRGETPNTFEEQEYLARVRDIFLQLAAADDRFRTIDGRQSAEAIHATVLQDLRALCRQISRHIRNALRDIACKGESCEHAIQFSHRHAKAQAAANAIARIALGTKFLRYAGPMELWSGAERLLIPRG